MTRVYGRLQDKATKEPLAGYILFEPEEICYLSGGTLYARPHCYQRLADDGAFSVQAEPGRYRVFVDCVKLEVDVPSQKEITLKEMLSIRYRP